MSKILLSYSLTAIFIIGLVVIISAQNTSSLRNYYNNCYRAEHFITENKFDSAVTYYQSAFSNGVNHFNIDLNNALICALESNQEEVAEQYIKRLLTQGLTTNYFWKKFYFKNKIANSPSLRNFLLSQFVGNQLDSSKIKLIDSLVIVDQNPRRNNLPDSIVLETDSINELLLKAGVFDGMLFPTEGELGVKIFSDTIFRYSDLSVLLTHQTRNDPIRYRALMEYNLNNGRIRPPQFLNFASIFMPRDSHHLIGCEARMFGIIEYFEKERFTCCCKLKELIDSNRERYYLDRVDNIIAKYLYLQTNNLPFIFDIGVSYIDPPDNPHVLELKRSREHDPNYIKF